MTKFYIAGAALILAATSAQSEISVLNTAAASRQERKSLAETAVALRANNRSRATETGSRSEYE